MLLPLSLSTCSGPVFMSSLGMSSSEDTRPTLARKYWVTASASNSNSRTLSPRARSRTFRWSSLRRALLSSISTMSEKPASMTLWANGEGVPVNGTALTPIFPLSIISRTTLAFLMSMSSSRISL